MRRLIFIASWQDNNVDDLILQSSSSTNLENVLVVVELGENIEKEQFNTLPCSLDSSKSPIKHIYDCQVEYLPYSVEIVDENGKFQSGTKLIPSYPELESTDTSVYFAKAIEAYNNFDLHHASKWFHCLLLKDPNHQQGLFNLASILHMSGYPTLSVHLIERLLVQNPDDIIAHSFLWALTSNPDCSAPVTVNAYKRLAALGDLRAITKLATLTGEGAAATRGDPSYARQIYEDMGESFESKLVDRLGYRGPWLLFDMLEELYSQSLLLVEGTSQIVMPQTKGDWRFLDVGCGSGLVGRIFAAYVANRDRSKVSTSLSLTDALACGGAVMSGVDISPKMVEITLRGGGYDHAQAADLSQALQSVNGMDTSFERLDVVVAADTFIYIGALGEVFAEVRRALRPNGLLVFSCEDLERSPMRVDGTEVVSNTDSEVSDYVIVGNESNDGENEIAGAVPGWGCQLLRSARFAHSHRYIEALCERHGFRVLAHQETILRTEETIPLGGNLYILQKEEKEVEKGVK